MLEKINYVKRWQDGISEIFRKTNTLQDRKAGVPWERGWEKELKVLLRKSL